MANKASRFWPFFVLNFVPFLYDRSNMTTFCIALFYPKKMIYHKLGIKLYTQILNIYKKIIHKDILTFRES